MNGESGGGPGSLRRHAVLLTVLVASVLVGAGLVAWAVGYDRHAVRILPTGTTIGGLDVGGMRFQAAVDLLREEVEQPLHRPITVQAEHFQATTTAWDLGRHVDVPGAVRRALDRNRDGNLAVRVWRRLFGHRQRDFALAPRWSSPRPVDALVAQAGQAVAVSPQDAKLDTSSGFVAVVPDRTGRALDAAQAKGILREAAERGTTVARLPTVPVPAKTQASAFSTVILVRTGENRLYLYKNGVVVKTYPVATGTAAYPSPPGIWRVTGKLVNPVWINPGSAWAKAMPARIEPGPRNPLGTRALSLNAPGILIHATPDRSSIGFSASHGCIRMLPEDKLDLFSQVAVGTPVAIVAAGPPKPRSAVPTPPAASPDEVATIQY